MSHDTAAIAAKNADLQTVLAQISTEQGKPIPDPNLLAAYQAKEIQIRGEIAVLQTHTTEADLSTAAQNPQIPIILNDQCYLIEKAKEIYAHFTAHKPLALQPEKIDGRYVVRQLGRGSLSNWKTNLKYINHITLLDKTKAFFEITPEEKAQLSHYAAITAVHRKVGAPERQKEVTEIFNSNSHKDFSDLDLFQSSGERSGAGINSINITYEGVDSATKKIVLVDVEYLFQDIRTMTKEPYRELFTLGMHDNAAGSARRFRTIDFELGWKTRKHTVGAERESLSKKLNLDNLILHLRTHLVKYTFDIKNDGAITVQAQYRGHIADLFSGPASNILAIARSYYLEVANQIDAIQATALIRARASLRQAKEKMYEDTAFLIMRRALTMSNGSTKTWAEQITDSSTPGNAVNRIIGQGVDDVGAAYSSTAQTGMNFTLRRILVDFIPEGVRNASEATLPGTIVNEEMQFGGFGPQDANDDFRVLKAALKAQVDRLKAQFSTNSSPSERQNIINSWLSLDLRGAAGASGAAAAIHSARSAASIAAQAQIRQAKMARFLALQSIGKRLIQKNEVHYLYLETSSIVSFMDASSRNDPTKIKTILAATGSPGLSIAKTVQPVTMTLDKLKREKFQVLPFVFLGKLLENVLDLPASTSDSTTIHALMRKQFGTFFNVDCGFLTYKQPYTGDLNENFPLYYFPISLKKINDFFVREIVAKEREHYSFEQFVLGVTRKFLTSIFSTCMKEANTNHLAIPRLQTVVGTKGGKFQYFLSGAKNVRHDLKQIGNFNFGKYNDNFTNNVFHFYLGGQIKGIVQNVKVTDIADPSTKTGVYSAMRASARSETSLTTAAAFPPVVFSAEIETMGFPLFNMGQLIYVDLKPYISGEEQGRQFKANGYYGIIKVAHNFSADKYTSTVSAIIQYSDYDHKNPQTSGASSGAPAPTTGMSAAATAELAMVDQKTEFFQKRTEFFKTYLTQGLPANLGSGSLGVGSPQARSVGFGPAPVGMPITHYERITGDELSAAQTAQTKWLANNLGPAADPAAEAKFEAAHPKEYDILRRTGKLGSGFGGDIATTGGDEAPGGKVY